LDSLKYQVFYWAIYLETVAPELNSTKKLKIAFDWKATVTQTINQESSVEIENFSTDNILMFNFYSLQLPFIKK
jgi:hypothetical protein